MKYREYLGVVGLLVFSYRNCYLVDLIPFLVDNGMKCGNVYNFLPYAKNKFNDVVLTWFFLL
jgi:hypothetical protein